MKKEQLLFKKRSPGRTFLGLLAILLLLTVSACGGGKSVQVYDNARVLNSSKVQNAASSLPNPIAIYTTNTFQGTEADFQRTAIQKLNGNPDMIVMAIDTNSRYLYIARGGNVPLSSTGINQAVNAFAGRFNNGDYTNASIAALNSMNNSIGASTQSRGPSLSPLIPCLLIPLLIILGIAFFGATRRNRMRGSMLGNQGGPWAPSRNPQMNEGPYYGPNQGPNQGYGPPYNQGYGPNQRGGLNPWAAGGLGAAAGGIAGYELGRMAGERGSEQNYDNANGDAGGGGGFFGGGGDQGDQSGFGNDSGAFGGGGNFGGGFGGSNLFGGGGSFGDSGGGDDSGGGGFFGGGGGSDDDSGGGGNF